MGSYFKAILLLIVLVALVTFGIQNNETLQLNYYFNMTSMPIPVYGIVYASILLGIFIGMLVGFSARFNQRKRIKILEKENRNLKSKVSDDTSEEQPQDTTEEMTVPEPQTDATLEIKSDLDK
jgi:uncharacterized integral membrane protein